MFTISNYLQQWTFSIGFHFKKNSLDTCPKQKYHITTEGELCWISNAGRLIFSYLFFYTLKAIMYPGYNI